MLAAQNLWNSLVRYWNCIEQECLILSFLGAKNLDEGLKDMSTESPREMNDVKFSDKLLYIYTSGTTGLPKAAVIKHSR